MEEQTIPQNTQEQSDTQIAEQLAALVGTNPVPEEKHNLHSFLTKVVESDDTTKTANLTEEELGNLSNTVRSTKELSLIASDIMDNSFISEYMEKEAEIMQSTSLSKNAKLLNLSVMQRHEISDITPKPRKENKGWFKRKKRITEEDIS